jgi:hypothetical protein
MKSWLEESVLHELNGYMMDPGLPNGFVPTSRRFVRTNPSNFHHDDALFMPPSIPSMQLLVIWSLWLETSSPA